MPSQPELKRPQLPPDSPPKTPVLEFYMPATPPLASLEKVAFWMGLLRRRHHFRRLFIPLLRKEDGTLSDMGLKQSDIEWALSLPLNIDALKALLVCCKSRSESETLGKRGVIPVSEA